MAQYESLQEVVRELEDAASVAGEAAHGEAAEVGALRKSAEFRTWQRQQRHRELQEVGADTELGGEEEDMGAGDDEQQGEAGQPAQGADPADGEGDITEDAKAYMVFANKVCSWHALTKHGYSCVHACICVYVCYV